MSSPRLAWYGDDFTGATDTLATAAQAGLRSLLFLGVPRPGHLQAAGPLDAVGVAGAARAMDPVAMEAELDPVGRFFATLGARLLHYKCCSTFDSAPHVGSIGTAVQVLNRHLASPWIPIVGGQPSLGRYCCFSQLYAAAGTGGEVFRIDRHPTMAHHPVTPMHEADLRRHLALQGLEGIAGLHYPLYAQAPTQQDAALDKTLAGGARAVLLDVSGPEDLPFVGRLLWENTRAAPLLAVGSSGLVQALAAYWRSHGGEQPAALPTIAPVTGPVFALAGSLSPQTAKQVAAARSFQTVPLDVRRLLADAAYTAHCTEAVLAGLAAGHHMLAATATTPRDAGLDAQAIARATGDFVARIVRARADAGQPLLRIGIAGGDTSSLAAQRLGLWALTCQGVLAPGVTLSRARSDTPALDGLELMLKGGQMGPEDIFERLVYGTGG